MVHVQYLQDKRDDTDKFNAKVKLPPNYLEHMLPLYERLSTVSPLQRCVPGLTQNQNEAFNRTIWMRCPKETFAGSDAVERGVASAVLQWKIGATGRRHFMERLGIPVGSLTERAMTQKDNERLYNGRRN